jgi:hypothetical protein
MQCTSLYTLLRPYGFVIKLRVLLERQMTTRTYLKYVTVQAFTNLCIFIELRTLLERHKITRTYV